eukprot:11111_5
MSWIRTRTARFPSRSLILRQKPPSKNSTWMAIICLSSLRQASTCLTLTSRWNNRQERNEVVLDETLPPKMMIQFHHRDRLV